MSNFPELKLFTFTDTGIKILIRKVSPMLGNELRKAFPPPKPPIQEVEVDGEKVRESNPAHPDYVAAMNAYNQEMEVRMRRLLIKRGVEYLPDQEAEALTQVDELRKSWMEDYGQPLDEPSDKVVYIWFIAAGTDKGIEEITSAILSRSQPSQEDVNIAKDSFRG